MAKLNIDIEYVAQLAELLQKTGLTEIEISEGDAQIKVAKKPPKELMVEAAPMRAAAPAQPAMASASPAVEAAPVVQDSNHPGAVKSPMVGSVYLAPEPGAPFFVSVGDKVTEGQTLLIIEAMKVMNSIRADRSGTVVKIMVENGHAVEYGEPLMIIE